MDAVRSGEARLIGMSDLEEAMASVTPSATAWFQAARNVVDFANSDGIYDGLRDYMKANRLK
jgi:hypothetical protein